MVKRKTVDAAEGTTDTAVADAIQPEAQAAIEKTAEHLAMPPENGRKPYLANPSAKRRPIQPGGKEWAETLSGEWRKNEAGVRLEEDHINKLKSIIFRDDVPNAALDKAAELLIESGYTQVTPHKYSKEIDQMHRRGIRAEAEDIAVTVENIVREAKGMEPAKSFYISRS